MTTYDIGHLRLYNQQISQHTLKTPSDVLQWFGAMQGQEYAHAKWALGMRLPGWNDADIEQSFTKGEILRTHVMRPTWHFIAQEDIRWLLQLTAPRVNAVNAHMYRKLELDDDLFVRSNDAIAKALEGGKQLTRVELKSVLADVNIVGDTMRLGYIVHRAELDAIMCSGARKGKQFTYALLDERAPNAKSLPRDEALALLVKRYFTSHGPSMLKDFVWWSGLTTADAKRGIALNNGDIISEEINNNTYWRCASLPQNFDNSLNVLLLPIYDEYGIAYKDSYGLVDPSYIERIKVLFVGTIVINGWIIGSWKRTFTKNGIEIETDIFRPLSADEHDGLVAVVKRFGEFHGREATLV